MQLTYSYISDCMLVQPTVFEDNVHLKPLMEQLMGMLRRENAMVSIKLKAGDTIDHKDGVVLIPCINNTKLDEDVKRSVDAANLGQCDLKNANSEYLLVHFYRKQNICVILCLYCKGAYV